MTAYQQLTSGDICCLPIVLNPGLGRPWPTMYVSTTGSRFCASMLNTEELNKDSVEASTFVAGIFSQFNPKCEYFSAD